MQASTYYTLELVGGLNQPANIGLVAGTCSDLFLQVTFEGQPQDLSGTFWTFKVAAVDCVWGETIAGEIFGPPENGIVKFEIRGQLDFPGAHSFDFVAVNAEDCLIINRRGNLALFPQLCVGPPNIGTSGITQVVDDTERFLLQTATLLEGRYVYQTGDDRLWTFLGPIEGSEGAGLTISGSGTPAIHAVYQVTGTDEGKNVYEGINPPDNPVDVRWTGSAWHFREETSPGVWGILYQSPDDVAYPWLITNWEPIGTEPYPTVIRNDVPVPGNWYLLNSKPLLVSGTSGSTINVLLEDRMVFRLTLTGDVTATIQNPTDTSVAHRATLELVQDATGGRALTLGGNVAVSDGVQPEVTTAPNAVDALELVWQGTRWLVINSAFQFQDL